MTDPIESGEIWADITIKLYTEDRDEVRAIMDRIVDFIDTIGIAKVEEVNYEG